MILKLRML
jgi:hypothetical protein